MVSEDGDLEPKLELADPSPVEPSLPTQDGKTDPQSFAVTAQANSSVKEPHDGSQATARAAAELERPESDENESETTRSSEPSLKSHPVRERLLAKAREHAGTHKAESDEAADRFSSLSGLNEELDRIARAPTTTRSSKRLRLAGSPLSPNMIAIFGTLFGLATLASLFAVLIHLSPNKPAAPSEPDVSASSADTPAIAAPSAAPAAPIVEPPARRVREKIPGPWRIADSTDANLKVVEGKIGELPFLKAVQAAGLSTQQSYRVFASLKDQKNLNKCRKKDGFLALIDRSSQRVTAFEYIVNKEEVYQAKEDERGLLVGKRLDLKVERERVSGSLVLLSDSFSESLERAGFEPGLGVTLNKALDGNSSVEQFRRGDRLRVIAQEVSVLGEFSRYAGIEALEYLPVDGSTPLRIYYFQGTQTKSYVNAKGQQTSERGWRKPVKGAPITSRFNPKRMHPILHVIKPHEGTDFGAAMGTPVGAALYGTVTFVGNLGPNGNFVRIDHNNHYETGYSHLSRFADGLKVGDKVKTLQLIGYVGSTGRSTGPHLHFGAKKDGKFIDPESLHLDALTLLPESEREAFAKVKANYDKLLDLIAVPEPVPPEPAPPSPEPSEASEDDVGAEGMPLSGTPTPVGLSTKPSPSTAPTDSAPVANAPPSPAPPRPAAPGATPVSIYMSNRELQQAQPADDDGEVDE
jgi:murein DD-endopeptidase MepM/ murein hydrolase activator NlpD